MIMESKKVRISALTLCRLIFAIDIASVKRIGPAVFSGRAIGGLS
jgi:hypothetical protein